MNSLINEKKFPYIKQKSYHHTQEKTGTGKSKRGKDAGYVRRQEDMGPYMRKL